MIDFFQAFQVSETDEGLFTTDIVTKKLEDLPAGEILIQVFFSSINYKDALSVNGNRGVTKNFPHIPGIDASGIVKESSDPKFKKNDKVIVTGFDLGMNTSGGFSEYIRVPSSWVIHLPENLSLKDSMIYGTAGFTAALSVLQLQKHNVKPDDGPIALSGSTGGVGSIALALLSHLGYEVSAISGKVSASDFLLKLGAKEVINRKSLEVHSDRPFLKPIYAGVIDTVGGEILVNLLKSLKYNGVATCCGLVNSPALSMTVFPFILKGVSLIGIDSVQCRMDTREEIWSLLADQWKLNNLTDLSRECTLENLKENIDLLLSGQNSGRTVVKIQ